MHFIRNVKYAEEYKLFLTFEDGTVRPVDLKDHLYGEIPLQNYYPTGLL
ncbi:MAG: hypothetical protein ABRQ38_16905 [Candidatus Eremiobacterota bacterium]